MSANILVIEYEPRYVDRIQKALAGPDFHLEIVNDLESAVERCARFEPRLVIITSVLPGLKIDDAITQLRGRAGLRTAPVLILMSGYRGSDRTADAQRYGAQDILERPFSADALVQRVRHLLAAEDSPVSTQAIPKDTLDALRRSAGLSESEGSSLTSDELFGDILSDVEDGSESGDRGKDEQAGVKSETPPAAPSRPEKASDLDAALADLARDKGSDRPRRAKPTSETDVDAILSQTLAGLDIRPTRRKAEGPSPSAPPKEADAAAKTPSPEPPRQPPAEPPPAQRAAPPPASEPEAPPPAKKPEAPPPSAAKEPAPSGTQFGQYVLEEHIATGGMAEVYQARMMGMEGFQKTVAIKRILPHLTDNDEFVTMFIDEAKLAAQLNHNNIIHIYDLGKIDRSYYIAMEYIEGRDLRSILRLCRDREVVPPVALALYVATLLASALDYAHKKRDFEDRDLGLVHRDVSPQNVLISNDGAIKLCDFGIAKAASKASHTRAGALKGKLQYMSPEQAWGKDIDHRSDIFSLGLVLYEMLTGEKAFTGESELSILEQVRNPEVVPPSRRNPAVTGEIEAIVLKTLQPDRDDRYQSARDLQRDMERVMRSMGWSVDSADVARFLHQLESGEPITGFDEPAPSAVDATVAMPKPTIPEPETPAPPPSEPPPPETAASEAEPEPEGEPATATEPPVEAVATEAAPAVADETPPIAEGVLDPSAGDGRSRQRVWLWLAAAAVLVVGGALVLFLGRGGGSERPQPTPVPVAAVAVEPTPTETPPAELVEAARAAAEEEIARREDDLRRRLEKEFPTPTPLPPTPTPTEPPTPTPVPTATATPQPTATATPRPTATPIPPTPTPSVREGDIVAMGPGVRPPDLVKRVEPSYPPAAERMRVDGVVELQALVGTDGSVEQIRVLEVSRPGVGFERATEEAVREWQYRPATKNGVKVRMWVTIRVPFTMR